MLQQCCKPVAVIVHECKSLFLPRVRSYGPQSYLLVYRPHDWGRHRTTRNTASGMASRTAPLMTEGGAVSHGQKKNLKNKTVSRYGPQSDLWVYRPHDWGRHRTTRNTASGMASRTAPLMTEGGAVSHGQEGDLKGHTVGRYSSPE